MRSGIRQLGMLFAICFGATLAIAIVHARHPQLRAGAKKEATGIVREVKWYVKDNPAQAQDEPAKAPDGRLIWTIVLYLKGDQQTYCKRVEDSDFNLIQLNKGDNITVQYVRDAQTFAPLAVRRVLHITNHTAH